MNLGSMKHCAVFGGMKELYRLKDPFLNICSCKVNGLLDMGNLTSFINVLLLMTLQQEIFFSSSNPKVLHIYSSYLI